MARTALGKNYLDVRRRSPLPEPLGQDSSSSSEGAWVLLRIQAVGASIPAFVNQAIGVQADIDICAKRMMTVIM